jgi:LysR family transcriptional regulator, transcriptional activator for dmlA
MRTIQQAVVRGQVGLAGSDRILKRLGGITPRLAEWAPKLRMRRLQDLNDIRTFVAAAEAGTLSGAAGDLHLPTSTVSRSLTRLEKRIGLLLVRRSQRGLALTDVGREYLLSCKRALRKLREGDDLLEMHRAEPGGVLRVECPVTMARDVLAPLLGQFVDANPKLRVTIDVYSSGYNLEPKEEIDVFFKIRSPKDSSRRLRLYPSTLRGLFASSRYVTKFGSPTNPAELSAHRCIGASSEQQFYSWKLRKGKRIATPDLTLQVMSSDPAVCRQLALDGVGITMLPIWMAKHPDVATALVPVLPLWKPEPISLCALYTGSSRLTPKIKVFLDFLEAYIGTDRDPRLHGNAASVCFSDVKGHAM